MNNLDFQLMLLNFSFLSTLIFQIHLPIAVLYTQKLIFWAKLYIFSPDIPKPHILAMKKGSYQIY